MTAIDVLHAVRRRWLVCFIGFLLTAAGVVAVNAMPGVYTQRVWLVFAAPTRPDGTTAYGFTSDGLIAVTGLVARKAGAGVNGPTPVSPQVSMVDLGFRRGVLIRLRDDGGQWTHDFSPALSVEVAGSDPGEVRGQLTRTVSEIRRILRDEQRAQGVPDKSMITASQSPPKPPVFSTHPSSARAIVSSLFIGVGLTLTAACWVDRRVRRRAVAGEIAAAV